MVQIKVIYLQVMMIVFLIESMICSLKHDLQLLLLMHKSLLALMAQQLERLASQAHLDSQK